jgi:hypothetical protein
MKKLIARAILFVISIIFLSPFIYFIFLPLIQGEYLKSIFWTLFLLLCYFIILAMYRIIEWAFENL